MNIDSISAALSLSESCSVFFCFCSWVSSQVMAVVGGCECSDASVFIYISTVVLFHHGASGHLPPSITSVFPEELRHRTTLIFTKTPESLRGTGLSLSLALSLSSNLWFSPEKRSSPKTKRAVVVNSEANQSNKPNQSYLSLHHSLCENVSTSIWSLFNIIHVFIDSPWGPTIVLVKAFCI